MAVFHTLDLNPRFNHILYYKTRWSAVGHCEGHSKIRSRISFECPTDLRIDQSLYDLEWIVSQDDLSIRGSILAGETLLSTKGNV